MNIYDAFDLAIPVTLCIALILSWRSINARWMISSFLLVEIVSLATIGWAMTMPIGYYAWSMSMSIIFLVFVFGRRYWAYKLQWIPFFRKSYHYHQYTKQETALVLIFVLAFINNFITLIEVYLYYIDWISNAPFKLYVRDYVQSFLFILASMVCLSFAKSSSYKEVNSCDIE